MIVKYVDTMPGLLKKPKRFVKFGDVFEVPDLTGEILVKSKVYEKVEPEKPKKVIVKEDKKEFYEGE